MHKPQNDQNRMIKRDAQWGTLQLNCQTLRTKRTLRTAKVAYYSKEITHKWSFQQKPRMSKGSEWYIQTVEIKQLLTNSILLSKLPFRTEGYLEFPRQTKAEAVHYHYTGLVRHTKRNSLNWNESTLVSNMKPYESIKFRSKSKYTVSSK